MAVCAASRPLRWGLRLERWDRSWLQSRQRQGCRGISSSRPKDFRVVQYNVLANRYARNTEPWFLYGGLKPEGDSARAALIAERHVARGPDGSFCNVGWPSYVVGILSDDEIRAVEERDRADFPFETRGPRLVETPGPGKGVASSTFESTRG